MFDNLLVKYLQKRNNFKKIYSKLIENSIPQSIKDEKYETEEGLSTNIGLKLYEEESENIEVWSREIDILNKQSLQNYIECIQELYIFQSAYQMRWKEYSVLDVGVRSGIGSNLLGMLFCDTIWGFGVKYIVDALDIDNSWNKYIKLMPFINSFVSKDVFDVPNNSYDICFCSHTIEHLDNPVEFVRKITNISKEYSAFYCPYDEENISPKSGHRVINKDIITEINPIYMKYVKSINRKSEDLDFIFFITSNKIKSANQNHKEI